MTLLINPHTEHMIQSLASELPQSLLLTGKSGVGLATIARYIAEQHHTVPLVILPEKDNAIDLEKGSIPVEAIRDLYADTRSKRASKQIIVIDYAERMSTQAQNALLKLLEEPTASTHFILLTHAADRLLPTVLSRMHHLEVRPITPQQSEDLLDSLKVVDKTKRTQLLFMAMGLPAEITRLVQDDEHFAARSAVMRDARDLLQASRYDKLLVALRYKDDRESALQLVYDAAKIIRRTMSTKPTPQLVRQLQQLLACAERIAANGNIRLCLAAIVL